MNKEKILTKKIAQNLTEAVEAYDNFKEAYNYIENSLKEKDKHVLLEFCTWCFNEGGVKTASTVEILWQEWLDETEDNIKIVKTKKLISTTSVEGILVQVTGGEWYAVTRLKPRGNPWYSRACIATSTGRLSMEMSDMVFMKSHLEQPSLEEAIDLLTSILNGAEPIIDLPAYC